MNSGMGWEQFLGVNSLDPRGPITILVPPGGSIPFQTADATAGAFPAQTRPLFAPIRPFGTYYFVGPATFRISWSVTVANSGQLGLQYAKVQAGPYTNIDFSVTGTSYGHCQIGGDIIWEFPDATTYFVRLVNVAANESNINFMQPPPPPPGGAANFYNFPSLTFQYLH